jgi:hypothetical protein
MILDEANPEERNHFMKSSLDANRSHVHSSSSSSKKEDYLTLMKRYY